MMDDIHEIKEEEANTSTNAFPRPSCLTPPGRQALADSIRKSVNESISKRRRGDLPTIYIVPQTIRQVNAYEPKIVSIGPYHNGKERLQGMEEHKWRYLHLLLSGNPDHRLEDYLKAIEELEDKARSYYSEKVGPHMGNEFVKMMLLDACFIVELFLRLRTEDLENPTEDLEDPIFRTVGMLSLIGYDLLLLENQIPFFVLQRIFEMAYPENEPRFLAKNALYFFDHLMPRNKKIQIKDSYHHLLHLYHSHLIPTPTDHGEDHNLLCNPIIKYVLNKLKNLLIIFLPCSNKALLPITERRMMIPCATDLQLAGVKFKKNKESNNILNVKFSHGVLEITPFVIHDNSDTLFRNLLAFEQCYPAAGIYFTTYLVFMHFLVKTSKDVALLHHNGIIDNYYQGSDDEVAHLFNRLCIGIFRNFEGSYLSDVKDNLQKHCENKWNMWRANLKRAYFTKPSSVISFMAASLVILLTIIQTFFAMFPHSPSY